MARIQFELTDCFTRIRARIRDRMRRTGDELQKKPMREKRAGYMPSDFMKGVSE
jgi:hypothetical protein